MPSATVTGAPGSVSSSISTPRNNHFLGLDVIAMSACLGAGAARGGRGRDEVDGHARLIADDPGVVAWADQVGVARPQVKLPAVAHRHVHPARDDVGPVGALACVGAGPRLDVG